MGPSKFLLHLLILLFLDKLAPRLPELVILASITSSSVTIQWTVMGPYNAERPEEFVVMYGLSSGALTNSTSVIPANSGRQTYSTTLTSLQPGTLYYYRIITRNEFATYYTDVMTFITSDASEYLLKLYTLLCHQPGVALIAYACMFGGHDHKLFELKKIIYNGLYTYVEYCMDSPKNLLLMHS